MKNRLHDLRVEHNLHQEQLAKAINCSQQLISNYETGKRELPISHLIALADFYHTSTDYILGRTNKK